MRNALEELAERIGGVRAALVIESTGIEVASWGGGDFEVAAAEWADLWKQVRYAAALGAGGEVKAVSIQTPEGVWVALPVTAEYVLAVQAGPGIPPGRVQFYAEEWAAAHGEDFA